MGGAIKKCGAFMWIYNERLLIFLSRLSRFDVNA